MSDMQKSSDDDKDPSKPSEVDHGETPEQLEPAEDTGAAPAQQVESDEAFSGEDARPISGISPDAANDGVEEPQEGGTLPPV